VGLNQLQSVSHSLMLVVWPGCSQAWDQDRRLFHRTKQISTPGAHSLAKSHTEVQNAYEILSLPCIGEHLVCVHTCLAWSKDAEHAHHACECPGMQVMSLLGHVCCELASLIS